jgi:hypothetical protein
MTIVLLSDARIIKERKKDELDFYHSQLETMLSQRMFLNAQIELTTRIITMIEKELINDKP